MMINNVIEGKHQISHTNGTCTQYLKVIKQEAESNLIIFSFQVHFHSAFVSLCA